MLYNNETFLNDKEFLRLLDLEREKEVFAKIISLDFDENPLEEIEGRVTQGSVNVDGTSSVRRTCSLSLVANEVNIHNFYWGLNTKFKLYVGVKNSLKNRYPYQELYSDYPDICWFKMGTYLISTFSTSQSTSQYTINIQGKDKMALLNGEVGGIITPLSWDFGKIDTISSNGLITTTDYLIKDIILEAVHEHAQEPYWNIIINDLEDYGLELLSYRGNIPLYLIYNDDTGVVDELLFDISTLIQFNDTIESIDDIIYDYRITQLLDLKPTMFTIEKDENNNDIFVIIDPADIDTTLHKYTIMKAEYGDVIGYRTTDLTYPGDLISNVGEAVTTMLDKIVAMLGNFEYFYDLNGRFVFQRKKTYIQSNFSTITTNDKNDDETYIDNAAGTSACTYSFDNAVLVTSFSNSPNFTDIKNDFSLWGVRKGISGIEIPIHLRYAIDSKPWMYINYEGKTYITEEGKEKYNQLMEEYQLRFRLKEKEAEQAGKIVFKKIAVPKLLQNNNGTSDWWDLTNWAEYYFLLTGEFPNLELREYGTETYTDILVFPDGSTYTPTTGGQLIIDLERDTHCPFYGNGPNVDSEGKKVGCSILNSNGSVTHRTYAWDPFMHGFTSCTHTFDQFLFLDANNNCQSFIYKPHLPASAITDNIIEMMDDIVIEDLGLNEETTLVCDWRELIYQMSLDYNKYHHDEDFLVNIDKNNTLPDGTHLYLGGYTKYEKYYIDLNGFWRDLYDPYYKYSYDVIYVYQKQYDLTPSQFYFYQNCEDLTYEDMLAAMTVWEPYCGETLYMYNYKHQLTPLKSPPKKEDFEKAKDQYCFLRHGGGIGLEDKSFLKPAPYDRKAVYHLQVTGDYDPETHWSSSVQEAPESLNFWFDFLDTEGDMGKYKVHKIGDRTKAANDTNIKSIYFRDVPTVIFVNENANIAEEQKKKGTGYTYIKLPNYYENLFSMSSQGKSAMDVLNDWVYSYAYCAESITINALPIYYLEPNTRISVRDDNSGINGEYIVTRLTFPLGHNGTMSITATKAVQNLY